MPEPNAPPSGGPLRNILGEIKSHPIVVVGAIAGIVVAFVVIRNQSSGNSATGVPTDAAGNPLAGGFQVSPPLGNNDIATQLADMEQQILNWESTQGSNQNPGKNQWGGPIGTDWGGPGSLWGICGPFSKYDPVLKQCVPTGDPGGPPNIKPGTGGGLLNCGAISVMPDGSIGGCFSGSPPPIQPPPPTAQPWYTKFLDIFRTNPQDNPGGWFTLPNPESTQQVAGFFGLQHGWSDIAYNPYNQGLLSQAYSTQGQGTLPAGTKVFIPTSGLGQ